MRPGLWLYTAAGHGWLAAKATASVSGSNPVAHLLSLRLSSCTMLAIIVLPLNSAVPPPGNCTFTTGISDSTGMVLLLLLLSEWACGGPTHSGGNSCAEQQWVEVLLCVITTQFLRSRWELGLCATVPASGVGWESVQAMLECLLLQTGLYTNWPAGDVATAPREDLSR